MDIGIKIIIAVVVILVLIGIKMVCDEKARRKRCGTARNAGFGR